MTHVELLTVTDRFQIGGAVFLLPDFSVPGGRWSARTELVRIVTPDGQDFETPATFNLSHFNISDPTVSIDRRWRVTIMLPDKLSADVPVGSKLFASHEIRDELLPKPVA
ncbi:MAG TPA: hypothetical protein VK815_13355 [Candidatus Acidoferrales bacterium]|jgi:hypothetical protein|nr:hypothetical protein [Candidatus Acidoferrales bacterium]